MITHQQKRAAAIDRMKAILATAKTESRELSAEEAASYDKLKAEAEAAKAMIAREAETASLAAEIAAPVPAAARPADGLPLGGRPAEAKREFESFGQWVNTARFNPNDQRLTFKEGSPKAGMEMTSPTSGGYAIPQQFLPELKQASQNALFFRQRATVIPAGDPPDAALLIPALDQGAAKGMYGGVSVYKVAEGGQPTESQAYLKQIKLEPQELAGDLEVTDKLLRNWAAAGALISQLFGKAMAAYEETQFISGSGVGGPQGVIGAGAAIAINRAVANQIAYADLVGMFARAKADGSFIWVASQTTIPQLMQIKGGDNALAFQPNAREGMPRSLLGMPLVLSERNPVLGSNGDLMLLDLSYYLIKDGSGPFVSFSEHVKFRENKTIAKIVWNVDGRPWLNAALPLEADSTKTVSPFVALDVP